MAGYIGSVPGVTAYDLNDLTDVNVPSPSHGDSIVYDQATNTYINAQTAPSIPAVITASGRLSGGNDVSAGYLEASASAVERYTINIPEMVIDINGTEYTLTAAVTRDLTNTAHWDNHLHAGYTTGRPDQSANRAGQDYYVYACVPASGTVPDIVLSNNATVPYVLPSGVPSTSANTRKLGGFHCLCANVGTISGHELTGYLIGDVLPRSVWDQHAHRPESPPEGMVYVGNRLWADIYLASNPGGDLETVYGAAPIAGGSYTGTPTPYYHWYNFAERFAEINKRLPTQAEFISLALGSNEETNISGSTFANKTTGNHVDTANRRMISDIGCEDCCGALWQWLNETGGQNAGASWGVQDTTGSANTYDAVNSVGRGQGYAVPTRGVAGGDWAVGANCGPRGVSWAYSPLNLGADLGARGVSGSLY